MSRATLILLIGVVLFPPTGANAAGEPTGFIVAGKPIAFDSAFRPRFTPAQVAATAKVTRAGFALWAGTAEGRAIIARILLGDTSVVVEEDSGEASLGRAPQPGFTTLLAAGDRTRHKRFRIVLNPATAEQYHGDPALDTGRPRTGAEAMALAWAAEMLHINFYLEGIALPHHERADFQERWAAVTAELGFRNTPHGDEERRE